MEREETESLLVLEIDYKTFQQGIDDENARNEASGGFSIIIILNVRVGS